MTERPVGVSIGTPVGVTVAVVMAAIAVAVGVASSISATLGVALVIALVAVPGAVLKPKILAPVLMGAVFAESVTLGQVTISRLMAPLALIAVASQSLNPPASLTEARPTLAVLGGYGLLAVASLAWTQSTDGTLFGLGSLGISIVYTAAFAVLVRKPEDLRVVLWVAAGSAVVLGLLWVEGYLGGVDRTRSVLGDPNLFAATEVIAIPLVLALAANTQELAVRIWLYLGLGVIAASVLATLSRGGIVTLILTTLILLFLPSRILFGSVNAKVGFFGIAFLGLALLYPLAGPQLLERFYETRELGQSALGVRADLWRAALHGYRQHPATGLGFGAFNVISFRLLAETPGIDLGPHLRFAVREGEPPHNAYIGSLAEMGPAGLALFLGIIGVTARSLFRTARKATAAGSRLIGTTANALLVSLVAFSASSTLLTTETSRDLWTIVGLSLALPGMVTLQERHRRRRSQSSAVSA